MTAGAQRRRLRILVLSPWGAPRPSDPPEIALLLRLLARRGHAVTLLCRDGAPLSGVESVRARALSLAPLLGWAFPLQALEIALLSAQYALFALLSAARRGVPDLVVAYSGYLAPSATLLGALFGCPACCKTFGVKNAARAGSGLLRGLVNLDVLAALLVPAALHLVSDDGSGARALIRRLSARNCLLLPHPAPRPRRARPTRRRRPVLGYVGRLHPIKGFDELLALAPRVVAAGWSLVVVGDGPLRARAEATAARFGDRFELLGALPHDELDYDLFDLLLAPSDYSNATLPVLEALAAGVPVLARDAGDTAGLIADGYNGFLYEDEEEALAALCLLRDEALRARLSVGATRSVRGRPDWETRSALEADALEGLVR